MCKKLGFSDELRKQLSNLICKAQFNNLTMIIYLNISGKPVQLFIEVLRISQKYQEQGIDRYKQV